MKNIDFYEMAKVASNLGVKQLAVVLEWDKYMQLRDALDKQFFTDNSTIATALLHGIQTTNTQFCFKLMGVVFMVHGDDSQANTEQQIDAQRNTYKGIARTDGKSISNQDMKTVDNLLKDKSTPSWSEINSGTLADWYHRTV